MRGLGFGLGFRVQGLASAIASVSAGFKASRIWFEGLGFNVGT